MLPRRERRTAAPDAFGRGRRRGANSLVHARTGRAAERSAFAGNGRARVGVLRGARLDAGLVGLRAGAPYELAVLLRIRGDDGREFFRCARRRLEPELAHLLENLGIRELT